MTQQTSALSNASPNGAEPRPAEPRSPASPPPNNGGPNGPEQRTAESRAPVVDPPPVVARKPLSALPERVAAALSYLFGWISGLAFLLFDRRPFVRYHAAQSVVVFGTLSLLLLILSGFFLGTFLPQAAAVLLLLRRMVEIAWLAVAIVLMLKASSGERYRIPYAARHADRAAETGGPA
jgi:uncharacterized membrane protein